MHCVKVLGSSFEMHRRPHGGGLVTIRDGVWPS